MIGLASRTRGPFHFARAVRRQGPLRWLTLVLGLLAVAAVFNELRAYVRETPVDFSAFYCGGQAVFHRHDPYRVEPLFDCERRLPVIAFEKTHVIPDPAPGYAIVPFAALSTLPPRSALAAYVIVLLGSIVVIAAALAQLAKLPAGIAVAIAFSGIAYESVTWGQVAPFAIAAIAVAVVLARRDKMDGAGVALCFALIQPQFGLPALLAAFIFYGRARLAISLGVMVLAAASFAAVGVRGISEYPLELSIHSRAEVSFPAQYSLTWLVHALGGPARLSLEMGSLSYAVLLLGSLAVLYRYRATARASGAIILLPAAAAVLGGNFVHDHQIKVALFAGVALFATFAAGAAAEVGLAQLIMPFLSADVPFRVTVLPPLLVALATTWATIYWFARQSRERRPAVRASIISGSVGAYMTFLFILHQHVGFPPTAAVTIVHHSTSLASSEWLQYIDTSQNARSAPTLYLLVSKAPVWIGLVLILWCAVRGLAGASRGRTAPEDGRSQRVFATSRGAAVRFDTTSALGIADSGPSS